MGPLSRMIRDFCNGGLKACLDGDLKLIDVRDVASIDPVRLVGHEKVIVPVPALKRIQELLA